jgi:hypothetical protein
VKSKHIVTLAMAAGALGLMVGGLDHWADAIKPQFVAGVLVNVAAVVKAMYQGVPDA